jgi:SAM-dependent methyltransferase
MIQKFLNAFLDNFEKATFSKMTLSSVVSRAENDDLKSIYIKPFHSKKGPILSWVYRHQRKDITKNYSITESLDILSKLIGTTFAQADLYCLEKDYFLKTEGKVKLTVKENTLVREVSGLHNKEKNRLVAESEEFLKLLGVSNAEGYLKKDKKDKFIQINKFLEFFSAATNSLKKENISVLDMGSGKGYLTFAVYDYINKNFGKGSSVKGVEFRQDMVDLCNNLAAQAGFERLAFEQGTIADYNFNTSDVLIALHACDTATDEAIFKGISAGSKVIMVSPCCHKQVRKSMKTEGIAASFTKFGIMKERTAEILTDLIRASILEIYGYQTHIFEFVNSDHTPKNLMITAVKKREASASNPDSWQEVEELKRQFGISKHHLQHMLGF